MTLTTEQVANRRRLIEALRSGRYAQARKRLRVGNAFCCLGVACDLHDPTGWRSSGGRSTWTYGEREDVVYPPHEVSWAFGLGGDMGIRTMDLAKFNDGGMDFAEIAGYIDADTNAHLSPA